MQVDDSGRWDMDYLHQNLDKVPGIVEIGLFRKRKHDIVYVGEQDGNVMVIDP